MEHATNVVFFSFEMASIIRLICAAMPLFVVVLMPLLMPSRFR